MKRFTLAVGRSRLVVAIAFGAGSFVGRAERSCAIDRAWLGSGRLPNVAGGLAAGAVVGDLSSADRSQSEVLHSRDTRPRRSSST